MPENEDVELDQLLAHGRLSGRQYDEIERRVIQQMAAKRGRWAWTLPLPAAALAVGVLLAVRAVSERSGDGLPVATHPGFTARGSSPSSGTSRAPALLDLGCAARPAHVCRIGDTLMFSVNGDPSTGYLLAFAEPVANPGERIWYFPAGHGLSPSVEVRAATTVLPLGVRLGPPHVVGEYRVTAWLSPEPVDEARAQAQGKQIHVAPLALEIVE